MDQLDYRFVNERVTDADPRVTDTILNARRVCVIGCDLREAPMFVEYLMSGLRTITLG